MSEASGGGGLTTDRMNYRGKVAEALRGVVKSALAEAAEEGLPGTHHFYITFRTRAPGVDIPDHLRTQYPDLMTIVLQHSFWGLEVDEVGFGVTLSFRKMQERLTIPWAALAHFADPAAQFELHFEDLAAAGSAAPESAAEPDSADAEDGAETAPETAGDAAAAEDRPAAGADVVALDAFRKKDR